MTPAREHVAVDLAKATLIHDQARAARDIGTEQSAYPAIGEYGVIGDLGSAALVSRSGSVDWLCLPRFDSPWVFGRVLDWEHGGFFEVRAVGAGPPTRQYRPGTNLLETSWDDGVSQMRVVDFMPIGVDGSHGTSAQRLRLIRTLEPVSGHSEWQATFRPGADFGRKSMRLLTSEAGLTAEAGTMRLLLQYPEGCKLEVAEGSATFRGRLAPGSPVSFRLYDLSTDEDPAAVATEQADRWGADTETFWRQQIGGRIPSGRFHDQLQRSVLTLMLLRFGPAGSFVAAPTSSLPESIGGSLNWDYRYTWLRDCSILIEALFLMGFDREADDFLAWLYRVHDRHPSKFQIMYRVDGATDLPEITLDGLHGYQGSRPVRLGNAAVSQRQLDVYGELVGAAFIGWKVRPEFSDSGRRTLLAIVDYVLGHWQEAGSGLWEARGRKRQYLYSKVMCWVALDRALRMESDLHLGAARHRAADETRDRIRTLVLAHGFNQRVGAFTQSLDGDELDASTLHVLLSGMLPPDDDRVRSTIRVLQQRLMPEGLLYRYSTEKGEFHQREGAFLLCSGWMVRALAQIGRRDEAELLLGRMLETQNDLGLMAEEFDPRAHRMLGNFPQAISHLSVIRAILELDGASSRPETAIKRKTHG